MEMLSKGFVSHLGQKSSVHQHPTKFNFQRERYNGVPPMFKVSGTLLPQWRPGGRWARKYFISACYAIVGGALFAGRRAFCFLFFHFFFFFFSLLFFKAPG